MSSDKSPAKKKSNRHNFGDATRRDLAAAAGYKCSMRQCLKLSTLGRAKVDGTLGSANLGTASHIYSAAPGGPRPPPVWMTPQQIADYSNGIWTCGGCGKIVDADECSYTVPQLHEMKKVREAAQKMAASDPQICSLKAHISDFEFDEVFWNHLPDLDVGAIRRTLIGMGGRALVHFAERLETRSIEPAHLPLKQIVDSVRTVTRQVPAPAAPMPGVLAGLPLARRVPDLDQHDTPLHRAARIVDGWATSISPDSWSGWGWHYHHVAVKIAARDPRTGAIGENSMWARAHALGRHDRTLDGGQVLHLRISETMERVSNFDWRLNVRFENGALGGRSILQLSNNVTPSDLQDDREWADFEAYEQLVRQLRDGWIPVGFVSMHTGECRSDAYLHPAPFDMVAQFTDAELKDCLYRCDKIRLARKMGERWKRRFLCTPDYFERALDPERAWQASEALLATLGGAPPMLEGESPVLVTLERRDIKLVARNGYVLFHCAAGGMYSTLGGEQTGRQTGY